MNVFRGAGVTTSGVVVLDAIFNSFQLLLSLSGELVSIVFLLFQIDTMVNPDFVAYVRYPLLFLAVLYLITRIDRFVRTFRSEANDTT